MDAYYESDIGCHVHLFQSRRMSRDLCSLGRQAEQAVDSSHGSSTPMVGLLLEVAQTLSPDTTRVKSLSVGLTVLEALPLVRAGCQESRPKSLRPSRVVRGSDGRSDTGPVLP